jgi:hypothetical protein
MFSGIDEPECLERRRLTLSATVAAVTPVPLTACVDDAPKQEATKAATHATIHAIANGAAQPGARHSWSPHQASGGTKSATDWANSIAVN